MYQLEGIRRIPAGDFEINEEVCNAYGVGDGHTPRPTVLFGQINVWIDGLAVLPQEAGTGAAERVDHCAGRCVAAVMTLRFRPIKQTLVIQNAQPCFDVRGITAIERDQVLSI